MSVLSQHAEAQVCLSSVEVRNEDIITVQAALASCDPDQLLEALAAGQMGWESRLALLPGAARDALRRKLASTLGIMLSIEPEPDERGAAIIMPWQGFSLVDDRGMFCRDVGAALLCRDRLFAARDVVRMAGAVPFGSIAELEEGARQLGGVDPVDALFLSGAVEDIDALAEVPWPVALGMRIWLPAELPALERHMVVAHVLWALTYRGFGDGIEAAGEPHAPLPPFHADPDTPYLEKLELFMGLLNYHSWVSSLGAAEMLAAQIAQDREA